MKQIAIVALIILVAFVCSASLALAAPVLTVTPNSTTPGAELVTINGTGFNASENVTLKTTVTCWKPVVDGKCECTLENVEIRKGARFTLRVREVTDNVTLYIKKVIWWPPIGPGTPGFTFTYAPNTSTVSSMKIPVGGKYSIDVIGDAVEGSVNCTMTTTAIMKVKANTSGNFTVENIDTTGIPICNFTINATGDDSGKSANATLTLFLKGDASKDGQVNAYDCSCIARCVAEISGYCKKACPTCPYTSDTLCLTAADVDGSPGVTIDDAKYLAEYLIGLHGL